MLGFSLDSDGVFQPSPDEPDGVYGIVKRPGAWIHFQIRRDELPARQRPAFERDVYLYVDDVDDLYADLQRRGARIQAPCSTLRRGDGPDASILSLPLVRAGPSRRMTDVRTEKTRAAGAGLKVLVIGGTQFMGREIVKRLVERGHEVAVLHRRGHHDLGPEVRNLQADRADLDRVGSLLRAQRFDAVFDLAYDWERGTTADQVEATARACGDGLQRYVFMSSIAAYGPGLGHLEDAPLAPDDVPNPYVQHKAGAERRLFRMHAESGFPVTTFRPPFVHGPRQPFYREQFFWDRLIDGRPIILPDNGELASSWAFVSDVAESCVRAVEVPEAAGEAFNIGHTEPTSQRDFVELLARAAGVEAELAPVPREAIQAAGGEVMGGNLYFGEVLDLPPHTAILEKVTRVLGVTPTPFSEALAAGFAWYRTQPRRPIDYSFEDRLLADRAKAR